MQISNVSLADFFSSLFVRKELCYIKSNQPVSKFYDGSKRAKPNYLKDSQTTGSVKKLELLTSNFLELLTKTLYFHARKDNKPMNPNEVHFISCPVLSKNCHPPKKFERADKVSVDGYPGIWIILMLISDSFYQFS